MAAAAAIRRGCTTCGRAERCASSAASAAGSGTGRMWRPARSGPAAGSSRSTCTPATARISLVRAVARSPSSCSAGYRDPARDVARRAWDGRLGACRRSAGVKARQETLPAELAMVAAHDEAAGSALRKLADDLRHGVIGRDDGLDVAEHAPIIGDEATGREAVGLIGHRAPARRVEDPQATAAGAVEEAG